MKLSLSQNWSTGLKTFAGKTITGKELVSLVKSGKFEIISDDSLSGGLTVWIER